MEGVSLIRRAQKAGLTIRAEGDHLIIKGPRRAGYLVQQLIANKPAVLSALKEMEKFEVPNGWTPGNWRDRLRQLADLCESNVPGRATELREWADGVERLYMPSHPARLPDMDAQAREQLHDQIREDLSRQDNPATRNNRSA